MRKTILTVIITLVVMIAALLIYIYSGAYNIRQSKDTSFTEWMMNTAKDHSINKRIKDIKVPSMNDTSRFSEGFMHYNDKIWAITDFLLNKMNKMSPTEYKEWQQKFSNKGGD